MKVILFVGLFCVYQSTINCVSIQDFNRVMTNVLETSIDKIAESGKETNITFHTYSEELFSKYQQSMENAKKFFSQLESENPEKINCINNWKQSMININQRDPMRQMVINFNVLSKTFQMYENAIDYLSLTYEIKQNMKITSAANSVEDKIFLELVKKCFDFYYQIVKLRNALTESSANAKKALDKLITVEIDYLDQIKVEAVNCLK